jgi:hypothetical protein
MNPANQLIPTIMVASNATFAGLWDLASPSRVTLLADVISESGYARRFKR